MKKLKEKLNQKDGVSILFALIGFLVAAMISAVVVAAAVSSAERVANDQKTNQAHLTLESAAELVRDEMLGTLGTASASPEAVTYQFKEYTDAGKINTGDVKVTGALAPEIKAAVEAVDSAGTYTSNADTNFTVALTGDDLEDTDDFTVDVSFTMDEHYNLVFTFALKDSAERLYLNMLASAVTKNDATGYYEINWEMGSDYIYGVGG